jgi:hypothetical protein
VIPLVTSEESAASIFRLVKNKLRSRQYIPSEHWYLSTKPHTVTSQKNAVLEYFIKFC